MLRTIAIFATFLALLWSQPQSTSVPVVIPIQNPSFETPIPVQAAPNACGYQMFVIPGWTSDGDSSVLATTDITKCSFSSPPDGHSVAYVTYGHTISQDLGDVYTLLPHDSHGQVIGFYTLKFSVANYFYWYDGRYEASISLKKVPTGPPSDTGTLCSTSSMAAGDFTEITLVCPSQRIYGELTVNLSAMTPDWSVVFDKISLTFTPN